MFELGGVSLKKILIVSTAIIFLAIMGNVIHAAYEENLARQEENAAKNKLLEWLYAVEPESIEEWGAQDTRIGEDPKDFIRLELKEEQKQQFCQVLKTISAEEVVLGPGSPQGMDLDIWFYCSDPGNWCFRYEEPTVYVYGVPTPLSDEVGRWPWEIRNEKLNEFLSGLLE